MRWSAQCEGAADGTAIACPRNTIFTENTKRMRKKEEGRSQRFTPPTYGIVVDPEWDTRENTMQ